MSSLRKAQISMEFIMTFSFGFLIFIGFLAVVTNRASDISEKENIFEMQKLADAIKNEIILAAQVHETYVRKFFIPLTLNGQNYSIGLLEKEEIDKEFLNISLTNHVLSEIYTLPLKIQGGFVDVEEGSLDYCIAKGKSSNNIVISKNQIGLFAEQHMTDGTVHLSANSGEFSINVDVNCIENFQTASFSIIYQTNIQFENARRAYDHSELKQPPEYCPTGTSCSSDYCTEDGCKIYGGDMFDKEDLTFVNIKDCTTIPPGKQCKAITISHAGTNGPTGSDNLIELKFKASSLGDSLIEIGPDTEIVDSRIMFIPPSVQDIKFTIEN